MDLDTRWIKFKYSGFNKFLCVLICAVFTGLLLVNGTTVIRHFAYFGYEGIAYSVSVNYIDTDEFAAALNNDLATIIDDVSHNANQAAYDNAKTLTVSAAVRFADYARAYVEEYANQLYALDIPGYEDYGVSDWWFDDDSYTLYFDLDVLGDESNETAVTFYAEDLPSKSSEALTNAFNTQFGNAVYNYFCHTTSEAGESDALGLKNILYYAEFSDGSVATNMDDANDIDALIISVTDGVGDYFEYENGAARSSDSLSGIAINSDDFYYNTTENLRLYVSVDSSFSQNDSYGIVNARLSGIASENARTAALIGIFCLLGCVVFAVLSIRLAGNRADGTVKTLAADRLPLDIGFILTAFAVFVLAVLLLYFYASERQAVFGSVYSTYFENLSSGFYTSVLYKGMLFAIGAAICLMLLGFSLSAARNAKAGVSLPKHTFVYKAAHFIYRTFSRAFSNIKGMDKKAVTAVFLFCFCNIAGVGISMLFFESSYSSVFGTIMGTICMLAVLVADAVCIYKVFRFMHALDRLMDSSASDEPVDMNTAELPKALKPLAEALDKKNAQLQKAVTKAVKDERTRVELITNVSHDLKTPLTSVINYIDLLKKCNIEDETAAEYMGVIEEKADRLKHLIEDLIEASKVSAGNIALNKTKLNLNELADQAIVEFADDFEKNNLELIFEDAGGKHFVFADGTKIYRVLENLLSNARKYSAPGTRVYVRLYSSGSNGCFEIKNISKDRLNISASELTERFVRGDKARTDEGSGLGLSIAKELCALNGGRLDLQIDGDLFKATVILPLGETQNGNPPQ